MLQKLCETYGIMQLLFLQFRRHLYYSQIRLCTITISHIQSSHMLNITNKEQNQWFEIKLCLIIVIRLVLIICKSQNIWTSL